jgi:hypothetical protein
MTIRSFSMCVLGIGLVVSSAIGQGQDERPPVPVLSAGGTAPAGAENSYVFIDPRTEDGVVFYTQDGKPAGANPFGASVVRVDIKLSRHVKPAVRVAVARDSSAGTYRYQYELFNGVEARQIAWKWMLDGIDGADTVRVQMPPNWTYQAPVTRVGGIEISERLRRADPILRSLQLLATDARGALAPAQGIKAGAKLPGFEVISRRIPGLVRVLVEGDFNVPTFPDEPPAAVSEQVDALVRSPYNYGRTFTIGPCFPPGTGRATIAQKYLQDVQELEAAKLLNATSDFTVELKRFLHSDGSQSAAGLEKLSSLAVMPFEREFVDGLKEALTAGTSR